MPESAVSATLRTVTDLSECYQEQMTQCKQYVLELLNNVHTKYILCKVRVAIYKFNLEYAKTHSNLSADPVSFHFYIYFISLVRYNNYS